MWNIDSVPVIKTKRLLLNGIEERDIPDYNKIVLDRERNAYWGYDDVAGLEGEVKEESFYQVVMTDFKNKETLNFAVRLDGKMIGEVVLFDFDGKGTGELGCRIDGTYGGKGYGREAFGSVLTWALETDFLSSVVSKCFKENKASYKMLAAHMVQTGEDDVYYYFKKER